MHKRTVEIAVGIFVLLGMLALLMLAVKVSGLSDIYESKEGYKITAEFTNVGGLKPRAKVSMAGVAIGRVLSIEFDKNSFYAKVHMIIEQQFNNIPEDSQASIMTAGLLGDNYLGLSPGVEDDVLVDGSVIEVGNTNQALVLEDLISKFFSSKASGLNLEDDVDE